MSRASAQFYLVALGSNRRHHLYGQPRSVVGAAMEELAALGTVTDRSSIISTEPLGPAKRRFANAAVLIDSDYDPLAMLAGLQHIEREFGRKDGGQSWGDRVLDLDIVLWSGGSWHDSGLSIPHPHFRERSFVLEPALQLAADWRDPVTGLTLAQIYARLTKPRAVPR